MRNRGTVALMAVLLLNTAITAYAQERGKTEKPPTGSISSPALGQAPAQAAGVKIQKGSGARLVVDHIAHAPSPAGEGQSITIGIEVKNEGTAPSSGEEILHLECENAQSAGPVCPFPASQKPLPVLQPPSAPHASGPKTHGVSIMTLPDWQMGSYTLRAWIARPRQPGRSAVSTASLQVVAPVPDLVVTSVIRDPDVPNLVVPLWVTVKNIGLGKSHETSLRVTTTCPAQPCVKSNREDGYASSTVGNHVPALGVGATKDILVAPKYFDGGSRHWCVAQQCTITVLVDSPDWIQEVNENNNTKVQNVDGSGVFVAGKGVVQPSSLPD